MCVCMYLCTMHVCIMYICMYVCMYVLMYLCMHVCMYVNMYVCTYVPMDVCMCVLMYLCMHACMYVNMYVCTYVPMHVCMYECLKDNSPLCAHPYHISALHTVTLCAATVRYVQPIIIYEAILCCGALPCYQHYTQLHFNVRTLADTPFNVHQVD